MNPLDIVAYVALGLTAGAYGTLVGIGGGLLIVPALLLMHVAPKEAAGTSMAVVLANAASGAFSYLRQRRVGMRAGIIFALAGFPGALLGGFADQYVPRRLFGLFFSILLAFLSIRVYRHQPRAGDEALPQPRHTYEFRPWFGALIGFGAGFLASVFGIGGGLIYVPSMIYLFAFPAHVATATSTFIIALTAVFGTASHAYYGDVLYGPAAALAGGAVVGAQLGAHAAKSIRVARLMRLFSLAVFLAALWIGYRALARD